MKEKKRVRLLLKAVGNKNRLSLEPEIIRLNKAVKKYSTLLLPDMTSKFLGLKGTRLCFEWNKGKKRIVPGGEEGYN